jgi:uncharacterized protein (DUF2344 family)
MTEKMERIIEKLTNDKKRLEEQFQNNKEVFIKLIQKSDSYDILKIYDHSETSSITETARQLYTVDAQLRALTYVNKED